MNMTPEKEILRTQELLEVQYTELEQKYKNITSLDIMPEIIKELEELNQKYSINHKKLCPLSYSDPVNYKENIMLQQNSEIVANDISPLSEQERWRQQDLQIITDTPRLSTIKQFLLDLLEKLGIKNNVVANNELNNGIEATKKHYDYIATFTNKVIFPLAQYATVENVNCFAYAFNLIDPVIALHKLFNKEATVDSEFISLCINDNLLTEIHNPEIDCIVVYYKDNELTHAGIVTEITNDLLPKTIKIKSKWGAWPIFHHTLYEVPENYGIDIKFYKKLNEEDLEKMETKLFDYRAVLSNNYFIAKKLKQNNG